MGKEEELWKRINLKPLITIENNELDRALPPMGWHTWDDFVEGKPRDQKLYDQQIKEDSRAL